MAVVISKEDQDFFRLLASEENLEVTHVATIRYQWGKSKS